MVFPILNVIIDNGNAGGNTNQQNNIYNLTNLLNKTLNKLMMRTVNSDIVIFHPILLFNDKKTHTIDERQNAITKIIKEKGAKNCVLVSFMCTSVSDNSLASILNPFLIYTNSESNNSISLGNITSQFLMNYNYNCGHTSFLNNSLINDEIVKANFNITLKSTCPSVLIETFYDTVFEKFTDNNAIIGCLKNSLEMYYKHIFNTNSKNYYVYNKKRTLFFDLFRYRFTDTTTLGVLLFNGKRLCYTLEDRVRFTHSESIKMLKTTSNYCTSFKKYGITAIPDNPSGYLLKPNAMSLGVRPLLIGTPCFTDVYIHEGNYPSNSLGCVLVGEGVAGLTITSSKAAIEKIKKIFDNVKIEMKLRILQPNESLGVLYRGEEKGESTVIIPNNDYVHKWDKLENVASWTDAELNSFITNNNPVK